MSGKMVAQLSIALTPRLKEDLYQEAQRRRVSPSKLLREILSLGLLVYADQDILPREEYEILLNDTDAKRLRRLGHELELCELEQEVQEGPTPSLSGLLAPVHN